MVESSNSTLESFLKKVKGSFGNVGADVPWNHKARDECDRYWRKKIS